MPPGSSELTWVLVAAVPDAWSYEVMARIGWPGVGIL